MHICMQPLPPPPTHSPPSPSLPRGRFIPLRSRLCQSISSSLFSSHVISFPSPGSSHRGEQVPACREAGSLIHTLLIMIFFYSMPHTIPPANSPVAKTLYETSRISQ